MSEKRVIAFIVEGASEEAALGSIMKEYFTSDEVRFVVMHGDITLKDYISVDSILKKINDQIDEIKRKYRYKTKDFEKIIHITDTDGVFIDDKKVEFGEEKEIHYFEDHVETQKVEATLERNHRKADILYKLRKSGKVGGILYKIYFNSCNLEHVLFNELKNFSAGEKAEMSDDFAEEYEGKAESFIQFLENSQVTVPGTYQKTWDFIEKETNSLKRYSNMGLIFREE